MASINFLYSVSSCVCFGSQDFIVVVFYPDLKVITRDDKTPGLSSIKTTVVHFFVPVRTQRVKRIASPSPSSPLPLPLPPRSEHAHGHMPTSMSDCRISPVYHTWYTMIRCKYAFSSPPPRPRPRTKNAFFCAYGQPPWQEVVEI